MLGDKMQYPAMYAAASKGSAAAQARFFRTLRAQYALLILLALLSATVRHTSLGRFALLFILGVLGAILVLGIVGRAEQNWYKCRALAESIKTASWRFAMRSDPFGEADAESRFRRYLADILKSSPLDLELGTVSAGSDPQITGEMLGIRKLDCQHRLSTYLRERVVDQRQWYAAKASYNRRAYGLLILCGAIVYIASAATVFWAEMALPQWVSFAFDPLNVLSTSLLGWMQIRRHAELATSYNLTAHEIGIIESMARHIKCDEELSTFINDAELAFSREHTQWIARREMT